MKIISELFLSLFCFTIQIQAQLLYPISGTFQGKDAQGMAIHNRMAYLMSSGGLCRQYDLVNRNMVRFFSLASAAKDNHVNSACFGAERTFGGTMPVIYLGECKYGSKCFVEDISGEKPLLVQTIDATWNGKFESVVSWVVDTINGYMYTIARGSQQLDDIGTVHNTITKYRLPKLKEGPKVRLTENDVLARFIVDFPNIIQGCKIRGKYLYIVTGLQESQSGRKDAARAIKVIDLKNRVLKKSIDLTYVSTNEPEDMDFYKDKCLLYCGQEGGLYKIKL